jgi:hypothetical protein
LEQARRNFFVHADSQFCFDETKRLTPDSGAGPVFVMHNGLVNRMGSQDSAKVGRERFSRASFQKHGRAVWKPVFLAVSVFGNQGFAALSQLNIDRPQSHRPRTSRQIRRERRVRSGEPKHLRRRLADKADSQPVKYSEKNEDWLRYPIFFCRRIPANKATSRCAQHSSLKLTEQYMRLSAASAFTGKPG